MLTVNQHWCLKFIDSTAGFLAKEAFVWRTKGSWINLSTTGM